VTLYSSQEDQTSAADVFSKAISWYQNNDVRSLNCAVFCVVTVALSLVLYSVIPAESFFDSSLKADILLRAFLACFSSHVSFFIVMPPTIGKGQ